MTQLKTHFETDNKSTTKGTDSRFDKCTSSNLIHLFQPPGKEGGEGEIHLFSFIKLSQDYFSNIIILQNSVEKKSCMRNILKNL